MRLDELEKAKAGSLKKKYFDLMAKVQNVELGYKINTIKGNATFKEVKCNSFEELREATPDVNNRAAKLEAELDAEIAAKA